MKKECEEPITATNQMSEAGISALHGAGGRHQPIRRGAQMSVDFEITGRLGELQLAWLREHYSAEQLAEALARLPKKGYPLNVARALQAAGGPQMPYPNELLANDPQSQQRAAKAKDEALAYIRGKAKALR